MIAESADVARAYPNVAQEAVEHLLCALHRAVPLIEDGHTDEGLHTLRAELARYPGPMSDLQHLGVRAIFHAAALGRHACANQLGELRLLAPTATVGRYVLIGDSLAARMWARNRGIGQAQVIAVRDGRDEVRLRGLNPAQGRGVIIVYLDDRPVAGALAERLAMLVAAGAAVREASWRPGEHPDPDEHRPRLTLQPPA